MTLYLAVEDMFLWDIVDKHTTRTHAVHHVSKGSSITTYISGGWATPVSLTKFSLTLALLTTLSLAHHVERRKTCHF